MTAVIGAGLSGLSAAYYLTKTATKLNGPIHILEATASCGGWVKSITTPEYTFEQGPKTISPQGPAGMNTLDMIEDIGLSSCVHPITPNHAAARLRMIYANKYLHRVPNDFKSMMSEGKIRNHLIHAVYNDLTQPKLVSEDESIHSFACRRFGRKVADYGISPLVCGLCAGDSKEISVKLFMKKLFEYEQKHGGVIKGYLKSAIRLPKISFRSSHSYLAEKAKSEKWKRYTITGGMQKLPKSLGTYLDYHNAYTHYNTQVDKIEFKAKDKALLHCIGKEPLEVEHVIAAVPAYSLAKLVKGQCAHLADSLTQIPFVTVAVVNLYYKTDQLIPPSLGYCVPPIEDCPVLDVSFDSWCLPEQQGTVLTMTLGGRWFKEKFGDKPQQEEILEVSINHLKKVLEIKESPTVTNVNILKDCTPQYLIGHYDRLEKIRKFIKTNNMPLTIVGNSYDGIDINDVIYSAKKQIKNIATGA